MSARERTDAAFASLTGLGMGRVRSGAATYFAEARKIRFRIIGDGAE